MSEPGATSSGGATAAEGDGLERLARLYGVQTSYRDVFGDVRRPPDEAILEVLRGLGAPLEGSGDVGDAIRARRRQLWSRRLPPSAVTWADAPGVVELRLPRQAADGVLRAEIDLEDGGRLAWSRRLDELEPHRDASVEGEEFVALALELPDDVPPGFHRVAVEVGGARHSLFLTAAPPTAPPAPGARGAPGPRDGEDVGRGWGVFLPLYALRTWRDWGVGDLTDLETLLDWTRSLGGRAVATLPLLATADEGPGTSPYAPVSRLFWNEIFLDVERLAASVDGVGAAAKPTAPELRSEIEGLRDAERVDYGRVARLKRRALEPLAEEFFAGDGCGEARGEFEEHLRRRPLLEDYARFRGAQERLGRPWPEWPDRLRVGELQPGDYPERARRYHLFVQWALDRQLERLQDAAAEGEAGLYLDLPVGVPAEAFDVWRYRDRFVTGFDVGAPPDTFFRKGQKWGFPPLHPERIREAGFGYLRACLESHLRRCRWLRIDHVMGLHRTYWVPRGFEADQGVYVGYPAEELYGMLTLLARRHDAALVGEDLGTVPEKVRRSMARHGVHRMHVLQSEMGGWARGERPDPPVDSQAGLNTHDMPPFAAFLEGRDLEILLDLGHLDPGVAADERHTRERGVRALIDTLTREGRLGNRGSRDGDGIDDRGGRDVDPPELARAALERLAEGPERLLVVNLEDLWGETTPQNVPGTGQERPNWRWRARRSFEEFSRDRDLVGTLERIDGLRRGAALPDEGDDGP